MCVDYLFFTVPDSTWDLSLLARVERRDSVAKARRPNHWTTREFSPKLIYTPKTSDAGITQNKV